MSKRIFHGLRKREKDARDFTVGSIVKLPRLEDLPEEFVIDLPSVKDQKMSDFCAAAASCSVSELQEEVELSFEWVFAVAKMISDDVDEWGTDLRTACKVHTKFGAIEKADAPYSLETHDADFLRRIENWPDLFSKAFKHRKESYFEVKGPYDSYDDIRATMWYFKDQKCGVLFGVVWGWALSDVLIETIPRDGFGHAMAQIGWTKKGMFVQNSAGAEAGEGGRHFFSRRAINEFVEQYGAYMFLDIPRDHVEHMIQNNIKIGDNWLVRILKVLISLTKDICHFLKK